MCGLTIILSAATAFDCSVLVLVGLRVCSLKTTLHLCFPKHVTCSPIARSAAVVLDADPRDACSRNPVPSLSHRASPELPAVVGQQHDD